MKTVEEIAYEELDRQLVLWDRTLDDFDSIRGALDWLISIERSHERQMCLDETAGRVDETRQS